MKTTGYIDSSGKYIKGGSKNMGHDVSPLFREWHHDIERKQFAAEIVQPYKNGQANPEFVRTYPDVAKEYFNQDQIDKAERQL